ncbi:hypothetical protein GCM10010840_16430 [Deinococcus aerolatus]|uniref:MBG domain-containing protein n=1 Tax=Deinococcus aerolatus TaxID=522487 RepID=A0ABQ2G7C1_9DEIO|nr:hypothetical protein GCM10010840_16430 [Deinococcus aerolatus]
MVQLNPADSTLTIQSVGRTGISGGEAKATLTQRVTYSRPTFMNTSPPAALTSCPAITAGGSSNLTGSATVYNGIIPDFTTVTSASPGFISGAMATGTLSGSGWPATLTVADATNLSTGSVIQVGAQTYRVTGEPAINTLTVVPANALNLPPLGTSLTGSLNLIPIAVRGTAFATGTSTNGKPIYRLPIGDPTSIYINDTLYITLQGVTYGVAVTGKGFTGGDLTQGYTDVTLGPAGAGANTYNPLTGALLLANSIPAPTSFQLASAASGTPLRRYVPSAMSAGSIVGVASGVVPSSAWGGSSTQSPAAIAGNSNVSCGDELFAQLFNNYTKTQYHNLVAPANRLSSPSAQPLNNDIYWLGPSSFPSTQSYSISNGGLCGTGILIVNGNLNLNGTGNVDLGSNSCTSKGSAGGTQGFNGILYVIGNMSSQGNTVIRGAVIVEGSPSPSVATKLSGGMNITYDPAPMIASAKNLSPLNFSNRAGTWSQQ